MKHTPLTTIAFDCFGTIFDMKDVPRYEIRCYVEHVRSGNFSPYEFPESWWSIPAHKDSAPGVAQLQGHGLRCVALSNGSKDLLESASRAAGIYWDHIVDLVAHKVYKPSVRAYLTVEMDLGVPPSETLMVTANPTFGDIEGAEKVGMQSATIRNGAPSTVLDLAKFVIVREQVVALQNAVSDGGYDISVCMTCGKPVVCIPDGMAMCEACASVL